MYNSHRVFGRESVSWQKTTPMQKRRERRGGVIGPSVTRQEDLVAGGKALERHFRWHKIVHVIHLLSSEQCHIGGK